jgi:hypothetical protein
MTFRADIAEKFQIAAQPANDSMVTDNGIN